MTQFCDLKTTWESGHQQLQGMTSLHHQRQRPSASSTAVSVWRCIRQIPAAERAPRVRLVLGRAGKLWYWQRSGSGQCRLQHLQGHCGRDPSGRIRGAWCWHPRNRHLPGRSKCTLHHSHWQHNTHNWQSSASRPLWQPGAVQYHTVPGTVTRSLQRGALAARSTPTP